MSVGQLIRKADVNTNHHRKAFGWHLGFWRVKPDQANVDLVDIPSRKAKGNTSCWGRRANRHDGRTGGRRVKKARRRVARP
jgi:hypothetical protein